MSTSMLSVTRPHGAGISVECSNQPLPLAMRIRGFVARIQAIILR